MQGITGSGVIVGVVDDGKELMVNLMIIIYFVVISSYLEIFFIL